MTRSHGAALEHVELAVPFGDATREAANADPAAPAPKHIVTTAATATLTTALTNAPFTIDPAVA